MKKLSLILLTLFTAATLYTGCKKDDDDSSIAPKGGVIAKVSGDSFKATADNVTVTSLFGIMNISSSADGKILSFTCGDSVGTYIIADSTFNDGSYNNGSNNFNASRGEIKVTEKDLANATVSGTFTFTAFNGSDSVIVSDGAFNKVEY